MIFVCAHGAVRSRLAAAFFNQAAPAGWWATSAAIEPQDELGEIASKLVGGSSTAAFLDPDPPRPLDLRTAADALVAIDCDVAGADLCELDRREVGPPMLAELQRRVQSLAVDLALVRR